MATIELERIVSRPMWKTVLLELVESAKLDPWNIDISEVTVKYIHKVRQMKVMELHVPANIILAAAILVRMKSDTIKLVEDVPIAEVQEDFGEGAAVSIPTLEIAGRVMPARKVTLNELMVALEDVMKDIETRMEPRLVASPEPVKLELSQFDIDEKMDQLMEKIFSVDGGGLVTFTSLLEQHTPEEKVQTLLPLLHLWQKRKIALVQEEYFGEIFIKPVASPQKGAEGAAGAGEGVDFDGPEKDD